MSTDLTTKAPEPLPATPPKEDRVRFWKDSSDCWSWQRRDSNGLVFAESVPRYKRLRDCFSNFIRACAPVDGIVHEIEIDGEIELEICGDIS